MRPLQLLPALPSVDPWASLSLRVNKKLVSLTSLLICPPLQPLLSFHGENKNKRKKVFGQIQILCVFSPSSSAQHPSPLSHPTWSHISWKKTQSWQRVLKNTRASCSLTSDTGGGQMRRQDLLTSKPQHRLPQLKGHGVLVFHSVTRIKHFDQKQCRGGKG